ncbi:hypothetical protein EDB85DRAFT_762024 [Lactarius pseudohatsudake]|nr:hypothetical protein EDB85DRAFT_762024 [Lactarius pseudohatsudake]
MAAPDHLLSVLYILALQASRGHYGSEHKGRTNKSRRRSCAVSDPLVRKGGQVLRTKCGVVVEAPCQYNQTDSGIDNSDNFEPCRSECRRKSTLEEPGLRPVRFKDIHVTLRLTSTSYSTRSPDQPFR